MIHDRRAVVVGILALQGAFYEHEVAIKRLRMSRKVDVILVRDIQGLDSCDALIIPGGESTTIALLAKLSGLLEPLRGFIKCKPVWGTCAGAILLSQRVEGAKKGGQELLGGMSISIERNGWGSQVESFEAELTVNGLCESHVSFTGIFIRAPVILNLIPTEDKPPIEIIARLSPDHHPRGLNASGGDDPTSYVAVRQGLHLLTTFHPELTKDDRFHEYFVKECVLPSLS